MPKRSSISWDRLARELSASLRCNHLWNSLYEDVLASGDPESHLTDGTGRASWYSAVPHPKFGCNLDVSGIAHMKLDDLRVRWHSHRDQSSQVCFSKRPVAQDLQCDITHYPSGHRQSSVPIFLSQFQLRRWREGGRTMQYAIWQGIQRTVICGGPSTSPAKFAFFHARIDDVIPSFLAWWLSHKPAKCCSVLSPQNL
jgi:hypothetical protein